MKINTPEEYLEFTDAGIITTLYHMGIKIDSIDRTNPKRVVFIFKSSKKALEITKDFYTGKLRVEPSGFLDDIKKIKNRLYQTINF